MIWVRWALQWRPSASYYSADAGRLMRGACSWLPKMSHTYIHIHTHTHTYIYIYGTPPPPKIYHFPFQHTHTHIYIYIYIYIYGTPPPQRSTITPSKFASLTRTAPATATVPHHPHLCLRRRFVVSNGQTPVSGPLAGTTCGSSHLSCWLDTNFHIPKRRRRCQKLLRAIHYTQGELVG